MFKKCWENNKTQSSFESSENKEEDRDSGLHQTYPIRKSINYGTRLQAAKGTFLEYSKESSIHGFKYIGNHKHPVADRLIWVCALVLSIITCCFFIRNIWNQRVNNPVIVTFNEKLTHVWEIPFPSVTVCPEIKTEPLIFNFTEVYWKIQENKNVTKKEVFYWKALSQICIFGSLSETEVPYAEDFANASDLKEAMTDFAPSLSNVIVAFAWEDTPYDSVKGFKTVVTEEGICFTFNSLTSIHYSKELKNTNIQNDDFYKITDIPKWSVEKGFNKGEQIDTYPRRVIGSGNKEGLKIWLLSFKENEDLLCRKNFKGFKVILHTPGDEPQVSNKFIHAQPDKSSLISIKPKIVQASENLMYYEPYMRKCFYQHERPLRYFEVYSQPNCERECLANRTLADCGCVHFALPRNSTDRVCGLQQRSCLRTAVDLVKRMNFEEATRHSQSHESSTFCNCLPLCTSIQYKAELEYQNDFDIAEMGRAHQMETDPGVQVTEIVINFKEDLFNGLKRSELYSEADLIASCGGLLGLFMGVSILSLVELVYYSTVKLWANLKTRNLKNRQLKKFKEIS